MKDVDPKKLCGANFKMVQEVKKKIPIIDIT